jgi:hypothetical protein
MLRVRDGTSSSETTQEPENGGKSVRAPRIVILIFLLAACLPSYSKCVNRAIRVEGMITGPMTKEERIVIRVIPDPNTSAEPETYIKDGRFTGIAYFDSTSKEGRVRDRCSRLPETVEVALVLGDRIVDTALLSVSTDFVADKSGDFRLKRSITLHSEQ